MIRPMPRAARRAPGSLPRRRAHLLGATGSAALLAAALSGCGAGTNAQTNQVKIPGDGVPAYSGNLKVLNALIVSDGTSGSVSLTIANSAQTAVATTNLDQGAVQLAGISSGNARAQIAGPTTIRASSSLQVGAGGTTASFTGISFKPGTYVPLQVSIAPGEAVQLPSVPVVAAKGYFSTLAPSPAVSS